MFKIQISLDTLYNLGLLKVVINKLQLSNTPENTQLLLTKDWINNTLPEKYKNFNPDFKQIIELQLPNQYLISGFTKWVEDIN